MKTGSWTPLTPTYVTNPLPPTTREATPCPPERNPDNPNPDMTVGSPSSASLDHDITFDPCDQRGSRPVEPAVTVLDLDSGTAAVDRDPLLSTERPSWIGRPNQGFRRLQRSARLPRTSQHGIIADPRNDETSHLATPLAVLKFHNRVTIMAEEKSTTAPMDGGAPRELFRMHETSAANTMDTLTNFSPRLSTLMCLRLSVTKVRQSSCRHREPEDPRVPSRRLPFGHSQIRRVQD